MGKTKIVGNSQIGIESSYENHFKTRLAPRVTRGRDEEEK